MGALAFDSYGEMIACDGGDVLGMLNDVFGDTRSPKYARAVNAKDEFLKVLIDDPNNWEVLIQAYTAAGLTVSSGWSSYLQRLGTVQPQGMENIYNIAQFRYDGLNTAAPMKTIVHEPQHGGHVRTQRGLAPGAPNTVDSPCPMPRHVKK